MLYAVVVVALLVVAVLVYAARRPNHFHVQRAIWIEAPPMTIFPFIENLRRWADWSPYESMDPNMSRKHSGATHGKGAVYAWDGNARVGAGRMEIKEVVAPKMVGIRLQMIRPFAADNTVRFTLEANGKGTDVRWAMIGRNRYLAKLTGLVFNMDAMVGGQFEAGLENLKAIAEQPDWQKPQAPPAPSPPARRQARSTAST